MGNIQIPGREVLGEISYSGADVIAFAYIPLSEDPREIHTVRSGENKRSQLLGTLQTISITSTRSVTPVRALGRASPLGYSRGGRTFAGTLVFATLDRDPFSAIYRPDAKHESLLDSGTSVFVDQLPPFTVVITAANELGGIARQIVSGITLINYGVTYSIDDIYTETTYTYVAEDVTPLLPDSKTRGVEVSPTYKRMSDVLADVYASQESGTAASIWGGTEDALTEEANSILESAGLLSTDSASTRKGLASRRTNLFSRF